jgi:hypothetical protein
VIKTDLGRSFNRVLKKQSDRLPAGKLFPIQGKGLPL